MFPPENVGKTVDPLAFAGLLWPDVTFYDRQCDVMYSVRDNAETFVPAGNMLGKDFVSAFIVLWFFLTRHPCRVITTSADYSQLESVLWGEIRRFIQTAAYPLDHARGGPLVVNHLHLRKVVHGQICGVSYVLGRVAAKGEGLLGHHVARPYANIPTTLMVGDEASGLEDIVKERADTWAHRQLYIGNCYDCNNFFRRAVEEGDVLAKA